MEKDEYRRDVMTTCRILLESLNEGKRLELSELLTHQKRRLEFVARIVKLGDTFKSDSTKPIFGLLFTTETDEYILKAANEMGLDERSRVKITIEPMEESMEPGD